MNSLPYSNPTTSRAAAQDAIPKSRQDRRAICAFIASMGATGATDEAIARNLPQVHMNAARARRGEIWGYGLITDCLGETRPTSTGSQAKVWHICAAGLNALGLPPTDWHADQVAP